jgi:hypothetical protein
LLPMGGAPSGGGSFEALGGSSTGGAPSWGGSFEDGTGGMATGGIYTATGGTATGGTATGGNATGGNATGGTFTEAPPNGATCLCLLAESLHLPGGWPQAACSSDNPNDCTLQKAYCGQDCAGDSTCGANCIADFSFQAFDDAATFSYGSCTVIIRCPAPSS